MFTVDELLPKYNQREAVEHFWGKRDGIGAYGIKVSEISEYWEWSEERARK